MTFEQAKPKRRWQNLLYKKCPNCNARLEDRRLYWECPTKNEAGASCFFIKQIRAVEFLMDPEHPANACLSFTEREHLKELLKNIGVIL